MSDIVPEKKRCTKCGEFKDATREFFYGEKRAKDGLASSCKSCFSQYQREHREQRNAYKRRYAQEHKDTVRAMKKRHYERHKDDIRAYKKRYNDEHRDHILEHYRQYNLARREQKNEYQRLYNLEHKDRISLYFREYYQKHRDYIIRRSSYNGRRYLQTERGKLVSRAASHRRRARKNAAPGTLTPEQIQHKLKAQKYRCYYGACGHSKFEKKDGRYVFHLEHTIPLSRPSDGPRHDADYVVLSCPSCNFRKNNKLPHEWPEGGRLF